MVDSDVLLIENALVPSNKAEDLDVIPQQTVDYVVAARTLSSVETDPNPYLLGQGRLGGR
jgi:hypothetical protein